jgi:hypothetical protein
VVKLAMGGIVLTFSAAAYEEFKIVTINYLKSQNLILKTTQTTDKHEAVVVVVCLFVFVSEIVFAGVKGVRVTLCLTLRLVAMTLSMVG